MNGIWVRVNERPTRSHIYYFKKKITAGKENCLVMDVCADTRYQLYVNGALCCEGPCQGSWYQRYYETADCSDKLHEGENDITVKVLYCHDGAFISTFKKDRAALWCRATFTADGENRDFQSDESWECYRDDSVSFEQSRNVHTSIPEFERHFAEKKLTKVEISNYYEAHTERGCYNPWGLNEPYILEKRPIPQMQTYPSKPFIFEKKEPRCVELDAGKYTTAKLKFTLKAKQKTTVKITYAECRLTPDGKGGWYKNMRDEPGGLIHGVYDEVEVDGEFTFEPFWYRALRYVKFESDGDFEVTAAEYSEYFYPMYDIAKFKCSDEQLNKMWDVSINTVRCSMHEIYVDCPYYEQQQYDMDSANEAMFTYRFTADTAMQKKCITDLAHSQIPDGMIQANYPSTKIQVIPDFSLFFIFMVRDYLLYTNDRKFVLSMTGSIDRVLEGFRAYEDERGLFGVTPYWPFVDWCPEWPNGVPVGGLEEPLTVSNLMYAAALNAAAEICESCGRIGAASDYRARAWRQNELTVRYCYDREKGLFRNTPTRNDYSEHTTLWAILSEAFTGQEARDLMKRTLDNDVSRCTFSMNYFMLRALEKLGFYDYADKLLDGWRKMLDMHCTTWCENPGNPRSECHGWSSAPAYELSAMILGVKPASPGYDTVTIEPYTETLDWAEGEVPTPHGTIYVKWRKDNDGTKLQYSYSLPDGVRLK
ncbi:MAG: hypothetical protein J5879_10455 [Clostridia bacterium]|nr:hypothetical protein [Clostridia bacterium]